MLLTYYVQRLLDEVQEMKKDIEKRISCIEEGEYGNTTEEGFGSCDLDWSFQPPGREVL
jgi:hypothetical protein